MFEVVFNGCEWATLEGWWLKNERMVLFYLIFYGENNQAAVGFAFLEGVHEEVLPQQ